MVSMQPVIAEMLELAIRFIEWGQAISKNTKAVN
jgi:hypothetical protein